MGLRRRDLAELDADKHLPRFCDYEGSDYRTAFWQGQGREYEDLAERIALRKLLPAAGERLIDIGGGFGRLVDLYAGFKEIVLLDYSRTQLLDARARLTDERITYVAANLYQLPFAQQSFDTAVMVRVLHHLSDVPTALEAIHGMLRPGTTFILEYANKRHLKAILRYLLRRQQENPFDYEPWEFVKLNFNFHPAYVEDRLEAVGFRIEHQLGVSHLRIGALKRLVPARVLATLDGWLQQPTAKWKCTPSMFLRACSAGKAGGPVATQIFRCPGCGGGEFSQGSTAMTCRRCSRRWSTSGGIYDFREPLTDVPGAI
jgi:SAM-dependent methyltransferase